MRRQMCHSVQQENSPPDLATGAVASGWWPSAGSPWPRLASASPGLGWVAWVGVARRHRDDANHRSALLMAASGGASPSSPVRSTQPSPSQTRAAMPSLSSHARTAH
jgi:hypothetical protein